MTDQEVVGFVKDLISRGETKEIEKALVEKATALGSKDDKTVVLVIFFFRVFFRVHFRVRKSI